MTIVLMSYHTPHPWELYNSVVFLCFDSVIQPLLQSILEHFYHLKKEILDTSVVPSFPHAVVPAHTSHSACSVHVSWKQTVRWGPFWLPWVCLFLPLSRSIRHVCFCCCCCCCCFILRHVFISMLTYLLYVLVCSNVSTLSICFGHPISRCRALIWL